VSLEELVTRLNALGIGYKVLETGTDGAALVLPDYGRVLGLWPHWRGDNAIWVNPDFFRSLQIGAKQTDWVNPGGDRMLLCPESEFFIPDRARPAESFSVPHSMDPGRYTASFEKGGACLENRGDAWAFRAEARIGFRILRRIRVYEEKDLVELWGSTYLRQAGYDEETVLEVRDCPVAVGLWNGVSLGSGGLASIPLQNPGVSMGLRGLPPGTAEPADGCVVINVQGDKPIRAWLDASEVKTRAAYVLENRETGRATMVLKEFEKAGAGQYAHELERDGGIASPSAGLLCEGLHAPSCELSFRSPAAGGPTRKKKTAWRCSLWAFSGRTEEIRAFLRRVLLA
jgi:hypothetical protein